jgi:DNA-binding IclR family transcriptional regulator
MRIAAETGDTVFLMARKGFNTVCVDRQDGGYRIDSLTGQVGGQIPLGVGPASQAILAMLPAKEAEIILSANQGLYGRFNGLTVDQIKHEFTIIRERRFALDDGRLVEGISAVAVPVVVANGNVSGAIAINMTSARLRNRRVEDLMGILRRRSRRSKRRSTHTTCPFPDSMSGPCGGAVAPSMPIP